MEHLFLCPTQGDVVLVLLIPGVFRTAVSLNKLRSSFPWETLGSQTSLLRPHFKERTEHEDEAVE